MDTEELLKEIDEIFANVMEAHYESKLRGDMAYNCDNYILDPDPAVREEAFNVCTEFAKKKNLRAILGLAKYYAEKGLTNFEDYKNAEYWLDKVDEYNHNGESVYFGQVSLSINDDINWREVYSKIFKICDEYKFKNYDYQKYHKFSQKFYEYTKKANDAGESLARLALRAWRMKGWYYGPTDTPDFDTDINVLENAAQNGDGRAMYNLSLRYLNGKTVPRDRDKARDLMLQAAEGDYPYAQFTLYEWYNSNSLFPRDSKKALYWLQKAAKNGFPPAEHYMGVGLIMGDLYGVQDYKQAFGWFSLAASHGYAHSYSKLSDLYSEGNGVEKDLQKALECLNKAEELGDDVSDWDKENLMEMIAESKS